MQLALLSQTDGRTDTGQVIDAAFDDPGPVLIADGSGGGSRSLDGSSTGSGLVINPILPLDSGGTVAQPVLFAPPVAAPAPAQAIPGAKGAPTAALVADRPASFLSDEGGEPISIGAVPPWLKAFGFAVALVLLLAFVAASRGRRP
jgi:hypothetical protein